VGDLHGRGNREQHADPLGWSGPGHPRRKNRKERKGGAEQRHPLPLAGLLGVLVRPHG
jgi:hypothetical protein